MFVEKNKNKKQKGIERKTKKKNKKKEKVNNKINLNARWFRTITLQRKNSSCNQRMPPDEILKI